MAEGNHAYHPDQMIGNYRLIERVEKSFFYDIWSAEQARLSVKRNLMISVNKIFTNNLKNYNWQAQAKLDHLQIIRITEINTTADPVHVVMSSHEGKNLREILTLQVTLPLAKSLDITQRLLELLEYIHNRGVAYRFINPESIFLNDVGDIRLGYLGLGEIFEKSIKQILVGTSNQTEIDEIMLRYHCYMSPEQKLEMPVDCRSDIYSAGILLFEMLTGQRKSSVIRAEMERANIHEGIIDLVLRATAEIGERYSSSRIMREELEILQDRMEAGLLGSDGKTAVESVSPKEEQHDIRVLMANQFERDGQFDNAIDLWNEILKEDPESKHAKLSVVRINKKLIQDMKKTLERESDGESDVTKSKRKRTIFIFFELMILAAIIIVFIIYYKPSVSINSKIAPTVTAVTVEQTQTPVPLSPTPAIESIAQIQRVVIVNPEATPTAIPEVPTVPVGTPVQVNYSTQKNLKLAGFTLIQSGNIFMMGSPSIESGRRHDEDLRRQTIQEDYYISMHEVTQEEYEKVMGVNPSARKNPLNPVERVSWRDAIAYCNQRSVQEKIEPCYYSDVRCRTVIDGNEADPGIIYWKQTSNGYRLPTEIEWEFASRAGSTTAFYWGDDWSCSLGMAENDTAAGENACTHEYIKRGKLPNAPAQVNSFPSNPLGLYDFHGNIQEWCWDEYNVMAEDQRSLRAETSSRHVLRGGSWNHTASSCRSAARESAQGDFASGWIGFRVARSAHNSR